MDSLSSCSISLASSNSSSVLDIFAPAAVASAILILRLASIRPLKVLGPFLTSSSVSSYAGPRSSSMWASSIICDAAPVSISSTPSIWFSESPTGNLDPASAEKFLIPGMCTSLYGWKQPIFRLNSISLWLSSSDRSFVSLSVPRSGWWSTARMRSGCPMMKYLNFASAQYSAQISPSIGA